MHESGHNMSTLVAEAAQKAGGNLPSREAIEELANRAGATVRIENRSQADVPPVDILNFLSQARAVNEMRQFNYLTEEGKLAVANEFTKRLPDLYGQDTQMNTLRFLIQTALEQTPA